MDHKKHTVFHLLFLICKVLGQWCYHWWQGALLVLLTRSVIWTRLRETKSEGRLLFTSTHEFNISKMLSSCVNACLKSTITLIMHWVEQEWNCIWTYFQLLWILPGEPPGFISGHFWSQKKPPPTWSLWVEHLDCKQNKNEISVSLGLKHSDWGGMKECLSFYFLFSMIYRSSCLFLQC